MSAAQRFALEQLYRVLLSAVVLISEILDKPCPVETRAERRAGRVYLDK